MISMDIPENTIFELEPLEPPIPAKAIKLFKLLLLEFGSAYKLDNQMTQKELIDSMERCRRQGLLYIYQNDAGEFGVELTPTGSATAFLLKAQGVK